jgi:hypothetical protein
MHFYFGQCKTSVILNIRTELLGCVYTWEYTFASTTEDLDVKTNPGELASSECSESGVLAKTLKTTKYVHERVTSASSKSRNMGSIESAAFEQADVNWESSVPFSYWPDKTGLREIKLAAAVLWL